MKQALVLAATGLATTQAKLNDNFFLVDSAAATVLTKSNFLNNGGETLIAGANSGLKFYYQSLFGASKAQTIYKFNTYGIATPVAGATWPAAVALVILFYYFILIYLFIFTLYFILISLLTFNLLHYFIFHRLQMKDLQIMHLPQLLLLLIMVKFIFMKVHTLFGLINKL